jgi:hypothetical protein
VKATASRITARRRLQHRVQVAAETRWLAAPVTPPGTPQPADDIGQVTPVCQISLEMFASGPYLHVDPVGESESLAGPNNTDGTGVRSFIRA